MTNDAVKEEIFEIISDLFDIDQQEITSESSPDTLSAWDSLGHMRLITAVEEKYGLAFSPEEQVDMLTVSLVVEIVVEKLGIVRTS